MTESCERALTDTEELAGRSRTRSLNAALSAQVLSEAEPDRPPESKGQIKAAGSRRV